LPKTGEEVALYAFRFYQIIPDAEDFIDGKNGRQGKVNWLPMFLCVLDD